MAKKTSSNAVRKIDEQIKNLETMNQESKKTGNTSPTKKSSVPYSAKRNVKSQTSSREKAVIAPDKKKTPTKKTTSGSKNIRGGEVVPATRRRTTTKTIQRESLKNEIKNLKNSPKEDVVVPSERKDLEAEVNKILGIEEETPAFVPLDLRDEIVVPKEKEKKTKKKITLKPIEDLEKPVIKEKLETKIPDFLDEEKEVSTPSVEKSLDDVDVIRFDNVGKKDSSAIPKKKGNLKKKTTVKKQKTEKKPIELEKKENLEEFHIVEEKKEISVKEVPKKEESKKNDFKRKRKGKGYVVDIPKKPYKELESDLRSLYDRVNDVVDDFEGPAKEVGGTSTPKHEEKTKKKFTGFHLKNIFKKKPTVKPVTTTKPVAVTKKPVEPPKKVKVVKEVSVSEFENKPKERRSILDHISQKILNFFLAVLFTIFLLMVIAFIAFVIYVSTF